MKPTDFFQNHPVFRHEEFVEAHSGSGSRSTLTSQAVLRQHVAAGNLIHVRRGVYAVATGGLPPERASVNPYLLATQLTEDAVVAFHAALQFHGKAYSIWRRFHYITRHRVRPFSFRDSEFVPVLASAKLRSSPDLGGAVVENSHAGGRVRVTTLERALVDLLDHPSKGGGWEEIWRSLEMVEFFDLDAVTEYALRIGSALTVARVGFFLEQHREALMVEDHYLEALRKRAPSQAAYLDPAREPGRLVQGWNLVVPEEVLNRSWEENG
jgi:predicted transcriptional regulator of viral defense system